jgi:hypothetical protein
VAYVAATILIIASKFLIKILTEKFGFEEGYSSTYFEYNSLTVLVSSVSIFLFAINTKSKIKRFSNAVLSVSGATFGVYLIHEQFMLRPTLWEGVGISKWFASPIFILVALGLTIFVYLLCSAVELIRIQVFKRLENGKLVNNFANKLASIRFFKTV